MHHQHSTCVGTFLVHFWYIFGTFLVGRRPHLVHLVHSGTFGRPNAIIMILQLNIATVVLYDRSVVSLGKSAEARYIFNTRLVLALCLVMTASVVIYDCIITL